MWKKETGQIKVRQAWYSTTPAFSLTSCRILGKTLVQYISSFGEVITLFDFGHSIKFVGFGGNLSAIFVIFNCC